MFWIDWQGRLRCRFQNFSESRAKVHNGLSRCEAAGGHCDSFREKTKIRFHKSLRERLFNIGNREGRHCDFGDIRWSLHIYNFREFRFYRACKITFNLLDDFGCGPLKFYRAYVYEPSCTVQNQNWWSQLRPIEGKPGLLFNLTKNVTVEVDLSLVNIVGME